MNTGIRPNMHLFKTSLFGAVIASSVQAATLYWDPVSGYGGSATWDYDNNAYWWTGATHLKWTDTTGVDLAVFQGTGNSPPYTVTVSGNITVNKLQFENGNYGGSGSITGGTLTMAGAAPAIRAGNAGQYDTTINSTLAGVDGLTLSLGNGNATTLHLGGANTFTGGVNFTSSTGTVILGSATALGTGNALTMSAYNSSFVAVLDLNGNNQSIGNLTGDAYSYIQNGLASTTSTLSVNQAGNTTFAGTLRNNGGSGGTLALTKDGAGTLTLSGPVTYTGATTISAGTLAYSFGSGGTLSLPASGLSGAGSLTATAGVLQLNGNMTLGGGQSFTQNGGSGLYKGIEAVAASSTIAASSITMTGDLGKRNSVGNTVALDTSASNGAIDLNLSIGRSGVWYNLSGFTANAGTGALNVTGTNGYGKWDSPVSLTGALNITTNISNTGPAVFRATANSSISGNLGLNQSLTGYNAFTVDSGATLTISGQINGVSGVSWGGINKLGAGTLSLTNAGNTYGQGVRINGGTVEFSNNALKARTSGDGPGFAADFQSSGILRWGSGNSSDVSGNGSTAQLKIGDGVTATFDTNGSSPTFATSIAVGTLKTGALTKAGAGTLTLSAANTYTGVTTVNGGTLVYQNGYASTSHSIASGATLEFNVASGTADRSSTTFSGVGTLAKTGTGTLVWGGSTATFNLASGSLIDVRGGAFTAASNANEVWTNNKSDLNVEAGAIFDGVEGAIFVDALTGSGTIKSGYGAPGEYPSTITFGVDNGGGTFSGVLANGSAAGNYVKMGSGTQILSGANSYTGATTVNAGVLQAGVASVANVSGAFGNNSAVTMANISGAALDITGFNTQIGSLTGGGVTGGNVTLGAATLTTGGNNASPAAYAGAISGSGGGITKIGTGVQTFSGNNSYSGVTTVPPASCA